MTTLALVSGKWNVVYTTPGAIFSLTLARSTVSPGAARQSDPVTVGDAAHLGVVRMDLEHVLGVPDHVVGAARLRTDVVLAQDAAGGQDQREAAG